MISVWPKFYPTTDHYKELDAVGGIYRRMVEPRPDEPKDKDYIRGMYRDWVGPGYANAFYDPYNAKAKDIYSRQMSETLGVKNFDAWWLDSDEPDFHSNLSIEERQRRMGPTAAGPGAAFFNSYPAGACRGRLRPSGEVQAGRAAVHPDPLGLRAASSAPATALWSGDVVSRWDDLRDQISAGVNMSMSGMPNWTHDIGGFALEDRYTNQDPKHLAEWRELNLRWFQFGAFSPLFRSHGEPPKREIYEIAPAGSAMYRSMEWYDQLRYRLMPYIYTLGADTHFNDGTIMRGLVMDFPADKKAWNVDDQYLFGPAFLVAPVTEFKARSRSVYLPAGTLWYDYYSGRSMRGGQTITAAAPYERMPLFVRAGSIVPTGPAIQHTREGQGGPITLHVYTGADGSFSIYEDDGTSRQYLNGAWSRIPLSYDEASKTLTIGPAGGKLPRHGSAPHHPCPLDEAGFAPSADVRCQAGRDDQLRRRPADRETQPLTRAAAVGKLLRSIFAAVLAFFAVAAWAGPGGSRRTTMLAAGWTFARGDVPGAAQPAFDDKGWDKVTLPHSFNAGDGELPSYFRGPAWYRRWFEIGAIDPRRGLFVQFDGAATVADVYLNGKHIGRHEGGHAGFRFDLTDALVHGRNLLAVRVDNSPNRAVTPLGGDFTVFGGLYRPVSLIEVDALHFDLLDHGGPGIYARASNVTPASADIAVDARVTNEGASRQRAGVVARVIDADGREVARASTAVSIPPRRSRGVKLRLRLSSPRLWDGIRDPYLYRLVTRVGEDGDEVSVPLGIRTFAFDSGRGFLLNGRPYPLRGANLMHSARPGKGTAVTDEEIAEDFAILREMGSTAVRLVHFQHPQRAYQEADRLGLVAWTEIGINSEVEDTPEFRANAAQQMRELIAQNYNHPSVVMWGIGNEVYSEDPQVARILGELHDSRQAGRPGPPDRIRPLLSGRRSSQGDGHRPDRLQPLFRLVSGREGHDRRMGRALSPGSPRAPVRGQRIWGRGQHPAPGGPTAPCSAHERLASGAISGALP